MSQSSRALHLFVIDERTVGTGRVLYQNSVVTADNDCVIPGNGSAVDVDIVMSTCAYGVVTAIQWMVFRAIRGVVDNAVNSVKSFLGISSPSKLFEGFGKNMGQGMEKGIASTQGLVNRAVVDMSMPSPTMAMAAPAGGSQTIIVELDGKTIARAIGKPFMNEVRVKTGLSL